MKPREFHLNPAIPDQLNVMRLHAYLRHQVDPSYTRRTRYQKQHVKRTPRQHVLVLRKLDARGKTWAHQFKSAD